MPSADAQLCPFALILQSQDNASAVCTGNTHQSNSTSRIQRKQIKLSRFSLLSQKYAQFSEEIRNKTWNILNLFSLCHWTELFPRIGLKSSQLHAKRSNLNVRKETL